MGKAEPAECQRYEPLLSAWLDRELGLGERHRVGAHLAACAQCRDDLEDLRRVRGLLVSAPVRRLPGIVRETALAGGSLAAQSPTTSGPGAARPLTVAATALGILVGLVIGAAFVLGDDPPAEERMVRVPVEMFVADHLVHSLNDPVPAPVLVGAGR